MNDLQYLSFDSITEGVGASQVLAYVKKIAVARKVSLFTFEKNIPSPKLFEEVQQHGINWIPLPFGKFGPVGGIFRIFRFWRVTDRQNIVHARGNMAGFAALLKNPRFLIWDCRALHADQRHALSTSKYARVIYLMERLIESILAKKSDAIIVITSAVIPILEKRYKIKSTKITLIPTCVNLQEFALHPKKNDEKLKILLSGTFSPAYDIKLTNDLIVELRKYRDVKVTVATSRSATNAWKKIEFDDAVSADHSQMPSIIQNHDIGVSIWKNDLGVCLKSVASTKTAEFLACGKPVFVNSLQGDFKELFEKYQIGVITDDNSAEKVKVYASKMLELLQNNYTPIRCRTLVLENFNLEVGITKLEKIYSQFD